MQWRSRRSSPDELAALHPNIPMWLVRPIVLWVEAAMKLEMGPYGAQPSYQENIELLQEYQIAVRRPESLLSTMRAEGVRGLLVKMGFEEFLDFTDFLVFHMSRLGGAGREHNEELEELLRDGGSEWTVSTREGHPSLQKRVPEGVVLAGEQAMQAGPPGQLLAEAWHAAFGRDPDPEEAYEKAIKAVEEAGWDSVSPNNGRTSLGVLTWVVRDVSVGEDLLVEWSHHN